MAKKKRIIPFSKARIAAGLATALLAVLPAGAKTAVTSEHIDNAEADLGFRFEKTPRPSRNDAGSKAVFTVARGNADGNSGGLEVLNDGKLPHDEDQPGASFFFDAGSTEGRILADLKRERDIRQINSYSWHPGGRAPQVYKVFGRGDAGEPRANEDDLAVAGWQLVASVDTRQDSSGGQHGASVTDVSGSLGQFRYLLFEVSPTAPEDRFGQTFFSEIDIVAADDSKAEPIPVPELRKKVFEVDGGQYTISIDSTVAPDLGNWAESELAPILVEWYPKIVALLPSEGYSAPAEVKIRFRNGPGVAEASGNRVSLARKWFAENLEGEAKGAVVHELVHVVQQYGRTRRQANSVRPPGWLVEGLADYIRWFQYEQNSQGAEIRGDRVQRARHDASYRVTANFLNWVVRERSPEIIRALNADMRQGRYSDARWEEITGSPLHKLADEWKKSLEQISKNANLPKNNGSQRSSP